MLTRRGTTLVELLIAIAVAGLVLGVASATVMHQGRAEGIALERLRAESQARAALALIPSALTGLSPAAGDLVPGEARDTALQLRAAMAQGAACDSSAGQVTLSIGDTSEDRSTAIASTPRAGDSVWWWPPGGSSWSARRVTSVSALTGICAAEANGVRPLIRLELSTSDTVSRASPVRVTRQVRYSFYRAGDGTWQLGLAEWSEVLHAFAPPQPLAGPFLLAAPGQPRSGFRYFDAAGAELPGQGAPAGRVARVRVTVVTARSANGTVPGAYRDSADVAFAHVH